MAGPHDKQVVPATILNDVTPSDATVLVPTRGIYVGTGGNLAVEDTEGNEVTFITVASGTVLPISVVKVLATGTTALNIISLR